MRPLFLPLALTALLAACATPGSAPPPTPLLAVPTTTTCLSCGEAAWPASDWWRALGDPALDALMDRAFTDSPSLQAARARLASAQAQSAGTDALRQPQLNLGGDLTAERYTANGTIPAPLAGNGRTSGQLRLDAGYELDFWGRNQAALSAALSREQAAAAEVQEARLLLSTALARAYVTLATQQRQDAILAAQQARLEATQTLNQRLQTAGLASQTDARLAAHALAQVRQSRQALATQRLQSQHRIAALAGQPPSSGEAMQADLWPDSRMPALPAVLPADLLGRRPDLVAARWRVSASRASQDVARADYYPNVNLLAFAGLSAIGLDRLLQAASGFAGVGPAFSLPLYDGGQRDARLAQRNAEEVQAVAEYNQALLQALQQVADQAGSVQGLALEADAVQDSETQARALLTLAEARQRAGLGGELPVLDARARWLESQNTHLQLQGRQWLAHIDLIQALGGGYAATALPEHP